MFRFDMIILHLAWFCNIKSSWKDTQKIKIKNLKKSIDKWNTSRYNTQAPGRLAQLARASA
jgi:hypothetical protein